MTIDQLVNHCVGAINTRLQGFNDSGHPRVFESLVSGRRYIGIKIGDQDFAIEIDVKELTED